MIEFSETSAPAAGDNALRIVMAPWNFADQPMSLTRAMRARGHAVHHIQYTATGEHALGYDLDAVVRLRYSDSAAQFRALEACLERGFDIYHFWQRSLVFNKELGGITGVDVPLLKAHGCSVLHRFTGFDLRLPARDCEINPHSPYHHGYVAPFGEQRQHQYIEYLRRYVDLFLVQDPEMAQFLPEAQVLPRGLELDRWPQVGVQPNDCPLIVHASTSPLVKGSRFIIDALEDLRREKLNFEFKQLVQAPYHEARQWYEKADIVIDQILIGATGVLTLEAWALAKPCVTYLRRDLFEPFYETSELPVANANPDNIKEVLRHLIKDYAWREELARRGRETVERFHDINVVAERYEAMCREVRGTSEPVETAAVDASFLRAGLESVRPGAATPSFRLGLAESYPRLASVAGRFFATQERLYAGFVRLQISLLRSAFLALLRIAGRVTRRDRE